MITFLNCAFVLIIIVSAISGAICGAIAGADGDKISRQRFLYYNPFYRVGHWLFSDKKEKEL